MDFEILGPLTVVRDGVSLPLGTPKARQVLACLIIRANEVVSLDRLVDVLWGAHPPRSASHAVRNHVSELRKVVRSPYGDSPIITQPPGYRLDVPRDRVDAHRFEDLVAAARSQVRAGAAEPAHRSACLALQLWRGDPLAEFTYDEFAQPYIRRLRELCAEAHGLRFEAAIATGRAEEVVADLEAFVDEHPLRDQPRHLLVEALRKTGRASEANQVWQDYVALLESQVGTATPARRVPALVGGPAGGSGHVPPSTQAPDPVAEPSRDRLEELLTNLERVNERSQRRRRWIAWIAGLVVFALVGILLLSPSATPTVGLLFAGRGDAGWGDLVSSGVEPIVGRGDIGLEQRYVSLADSQLDLERKIGELAGRSDFVIVAWGFAADALARVAPLYPDTRFAMIDAEVVLPNVTSYVFANEEGAFLVGAAAALTSTSGRVGFIGGADLPLIDDYRSGFEAGARHIDSEVEVVVEYLAPATEPVRGFVDTVRAGDLARDMYGSGADVVFHAAGGAGAGIVEAARIASEVQGRHCWMIGVDVDEYLAAPAVLRPHVLTSMLQRADVVVSRAIEAFLDGDLPTGTTIVGVADGALGYSTSGGHLDAHRVALDRLADEMAAALSAAIE